MQEYTINVSKVEELQMLNDTDELDRMFTKAHSTVVQGGRVALLRQNADGSAFEFDEITSEEDLKQYKHEVFKYL